MNELSIINTFAYGTPSSSENVDNYEIIEEIDSEISESESAKVNSRVFIDFRHLKIAQNDKRQEPDIQVEYNNSWDPYLECVVYILKDHKFEKLFIVLKWINGQETVHWADDAYSRCPQKVIEFFESNIIFINE
ncbi:11762_t:CDS:2 [Gigaspora margarita]|uniref:11762_t:CDS:1 n=1 Tax=Gigaspora margarita TaxID=4874 RepID=A0ABM8VZB0_GIGMA|nr:11762_t:CDS:2 [Gigaspora margarita]